jgi:hypothetical protein
VTFAAPIGLKVLPKVQSGKVKFLLTAHRIPLSIARILLNDNTNDSHYTYLAEGSKQFLETL